MSESEFDDKIKSVKLCPDCGYIPGVYVEDFVADFKKYHVFCPLCNRNWVRYSNTLQGAIELWNETAPKRKQNGHKINII